MALSVTHAKTDTITDWTQADLDAEIALGNFPPGTLLADIVLPSDWNAPLNISGELGLANGGTNASSYAYNNAFIFYDVTNAKLSASYGFTYSTVTHNMIVSEGSDFAFGTSTGTMIGTGATQKIGFYGTAAIVRPNAVTATAVLTNLGLATSIAAHTVAEGGTGATTFTANRILIGNGTSAIATSANFTFNTSTNAFAVTGSQSITAGSASTVPFAINLASGQSAKASELRDSSSNLIGGTWSDGSFLIPAFNSVSGERRFSFKAEGGAYSTSLVIDRNRAQTNAGNWCGLVLRDNAKEITLRLMSNSFTQNDGDFEICHGGGSSAIVIMRVTGNGTLFYNPFVNTQNISVIRVPTQTFYLGGGSPSPQGSFDFEQGTIAATSGNSVADAAQLVLRGAPIAGTNMGITRGYAGLFYAGRPGGCPLGLRLDASQTANAFEIRNSSITTQLAIAANGRDFILDTTTGTKWGTATNEKQGWWNATPVVQNTGWGSITNVSSDKAYDANATTIDELADVLGTLIATLVTYGVLGA